MAMKRWLNPVAGLGLALVLAGCAIAPPPPPAPAAGEPDLRGTWAGTWGGTPLALVIVEQHDLGAPSGLYLGSLQVLGQRAPGVSGVMTSTIGGQAVSVNVQGWLAATDRTLTLLLNTRTLHGTQQLTLSRVGAERLAGKGESDFRWGPRGHVELTRQPPTRSN